MSDDDSVLDPRSQESMSSLIRDKKAEGRLYTRWKAKLEVSAVVLKRKGHTETAEYVETEIERIHHLPGTSDEVVFIQALIDQIRVRRLILAYCKQHDDLGDVIIHGSFGDSNPMGDA